MKKENSIEIENFNAFYGKNQVLKNVCLSIKTSSICCIVGPSGGGKSTFLRSLNRINDETGGFKTTGTIRIGEVDIYSRQVDVAQLRSQVGMVFQKPIVFPKTIEDNVLFGVKRQRKIKRAERLEIVKKYLEMANLWDEVKDRLKESPLKLSIGQQQRLCIARALAVEPEVLLLDEPTSALDPISTKAIEDLVLHLKGKLSVIFVTHNMLQAERISDQIIHIEDGSIQSLKSIR